MTRRSCLALAAALAAATGCMTIDTQTNPGYDGPQVYSGVRKDADLFWPDLPAEPSFGWMAISLADLPFSALADTVLLPVTIPRDSERAQRAAQEADVSSERPSPVKPAAGEEPLATAQRLFEECARLLQDHDPHLVDCYSIDARVELAGAEPVRGAAYKPALRAALARDHSDGVLVEWRAPSFSVDGDRVRIAATRATSAQAARSAVTFVVGPCGDGGWRILEETGPGLSRE